MLRLLYLTLLMCTACSSGFTLVPVVTPTSLPPTDIHLDKVIIPPTREVTEIPITPTPIRSGRILPNPVLEIHTGYPSGLLNLRGGPGIEYTVIRVLHEGDRVEFLQRQGDWYQVKVGDLIGYLYAQFVTAVR